MNPNPGRSGAMTRYRVARMGIRFRNMWDEEGKPWRSRITLADREPALR